MDTRIRKGSRRALLLGVSSSAMAALLLGLGLSASSPGRVQAAEPAAGDQRSTTLEEIVITARKREESLQEAPVSISATSGATLEKAQIKRIDDIGQFAPSLNIQSQVGFPGTIAITMRGIGNTDPILTNDSPVALYYDGVYLGRTAGALMDMVDVDRVEILRGPQGTLFGRNTPGGAVSIYTKGPSEDFGVDGKVGYASRNDINAFVTLNTGEIANTGVTGKFTIRRHQVDGYRRNTLTSAKHSEGAEKTDQIFLALHAEPVSGFTADYKYDFQNQTSVAPIYQTAYVTPAVAAFFAASPQFGGAPFTTPSPIRAKNYQNFPQSDAKDRIWGNSLTLNYVVNDAVKFKSITAYRHFYQFSTSDLGFSGQMRQVATSNFVNFSVQPVYLYYSSGDYQHQRQFSQELQFSGAHDDFTYVAGLYYFTEKVAETTPSIITVPVQTGPASAVGLQVASLLDYSGTASSHAAFTQVSWSPGAVFDHKLELSVGLRYTEDNKTLKQLDTSFPAPGRNLNANFHNFSKSGTVKYQWTPDFMTYVRYAEGYKAGGFSARAVVNGTGPLGAFAPEKAKSYEAGVKAEFLDHRVRINGDIYNTDYQNLQVNSLFTDNGKLVTQVFNAGKARYRGGEVEATVLPFAGLQLNGSFGYVDPKYIEYDIVPSKGPVYLDPATGLPKAFNFASLAHPGNTPKQTASASVQYAFAPASFGDLTVRADWNYISSRYFVTGNFANVGTATAPVAGTYTTPGLPYISDATKAPPWNNVGAQIILDNVHVAGGTWTATVYGTNLLNKYRQIGGLDLTGLGVISKAWGRGRTIGASLAAKF